MASIMSDAPQRQLSAGGWGSTFKHWIRVSEFPYFPPGPSCFAGFSGEALDSRRHHYLLTTTASAVPRRVDGFFWKASVDHGINPDYFYRHHYNYELFSEWPSKYGRQFLDLLRRRFNGEGVAGTDISSILPEPVLPVGKPDAKIPGEAWQTVYEECLKKNEHAPAGKCEYLRCKAHEYNGNKN